MKSAAEISMFKYYNLEKLQGCSIVHKVRFDEYIEIINAQISVAKGVNSDVKALGF